MCCQACCRGVVVVHCPPGSIGEPLIYPEHVGFARPADGEHCPASSLEASGVQPANPLPAVGSGLWRACAAIHCQWSSEECGGQIQCFPAHHTESSGKNSSEEGPQVCWQVVEPWSRRSLSRERIHFWVSISWSLSSGTLLSSIANTEQFQFKVSNMALKFYNKVLGSIVC